MSDPNNGDQWVGGPAKLVNETPELVNEITMTSYEPASTSPYKHKLCNADRQRDLALMRGHGFNIDWSRPGKLGAGRRAKCYIGTYGPNILKCQDKYGQYLKGVRVGDRFAAKYTVTDNEDKIVAHENEKQIIRDLSHRNIVRFRMAINLGRKWEMVQQIGQDDQEGYHIFDTYSRMFLIMDYAEHGNIEQYRRNPQFNSRLFHILLSDLCYGLQYLHNSKVYHGDLHGGNGLVFRDTDWKTTHRDRRISRGDNRYNLVAKWADFGESVSLDTVPGRALTPGQFENKRVNDVLDLRSLFLMIVDMMPDSFEVTRVPNIQLWEQVIQSLNEKHITMNDIVGRHLNHFPFDTKDGISTTDLSG